MPLFRSSAVVPLAIRTFWRGAELSTSWSILGTYKRIGPDNAIHNISIRSGPGCLAAISGCFCVAEKINPLDLDNGLTRRRDPTRRPDPESWSTEDQR